MLLAVYFQLCVFLQENVFIWTHTGCKHVEPQEVTCSSAWTCCPNSITIGNYGQEYVLQLALSRANKINTTVEDWLLRKQDTSVLTNDPRYSFNASAVSVVRLKCVSCITGSLLERSNNAEFCIKHNTVSSAGFKSKWHKCLCIYRNTLKNNQVKNQNLRT